MYQKPAWSTWLSKTIRLPNLFGEYARHPRLLWFPCSIRSAFSLHQTGGRPTDDGVLVETTAGLCQKDRTRNSLVLSSYRRSHFLKSLTTESAWEKRLKRGVKALPTKRKFNPTEKRSKRDYLKDFDTFGTWDNRIEKLPILVEESIKKGKLIPEISIDLVGTASLQGRCKYQEDRFVVMELEKGMLYFGVFDGHRGDSASEYMKERLHHHVLHHLKNDEGKDLEAVLSKAFISANNAFAKYAAVVPSDEAHEAGTTATVALLRNSVQLVVAHVGDSRALIYRKGEVTVLTKDHDPEDRVERERVLKENGVIVWTSLGRALVNGRLAMTRSLGDLDLKAYGVSATPDTSTMAIKHGKDAFLALISDGISFVMSNQEIGNCIATCEDAQEAAQALCDQALQFGSDDNVTAVVIPFGSWGKYSRNTLMYSFARNLQGRRH